MSEYKYGVLNGRGEAILGLVGNNYKALKDGKVIAGRVIVMYSQYMRAMCNGKVSA